MPYESILHILPALGGGGVECALIDLAKFLQNTDKYKVIVVSSGGKLVSQLTSNGIEHISLQVNAKNPWRLWQNAKILSNIIKQKNIKLIHAHSRSPAWSGLIASCMQKIPFVTTYHGAYGQNNFFKKIYNSSMVRSDATIAISKFIFDHVLKYYPSTKLHLINEGIDTGYFSPKSIDTNFAKRLRQEWLKDRDFLIMLPGRFTRIKGHHILLQALKKLPIKTKIQTIFVGPKSSKIDYINELKIEIEKDNLSVEFVFDVPDIRLAYEACDLIVCPSSKPEAFGRVVAEAMAMEKAVIGFDHGATSELLDKSSVVLPQDFASLGKLILFFYSLDKNELHTIGQNNREKICQFFNLNIMGKNVVKLYEQLIAN